MRSRGSSGSEFAARVHAAVRRIPAGRVTTYAAVARAVGSPGAARAVGSALRKNPFGYCSYTAAAARKAGVDRVPCHRVVRADGSLGEFTARGGSAEKRRLLEREGVRISGGRVGKAVLVKL